ncbi:SCO2400 family protein, partial [Actinacidiphila guanduensis]
MDYCYTCRRHLNGAYSCPGCGTPADRLTVPPAGDTAPLPLVSEGLPDGLGDGGAYGEEFGAGGGRAARRVEERRKAARRAKRGRRRVAVYGVGAVAVVGALAM